MRKEHHNFQNYNPDLKIGKTREGEHCSHSNIFMLPKIEISFFQIKETSCDRSFHFYQKLILRTLFIDLFRCNFKTVARD